MRLLRRLAGGREPVELPPPIEEPPFWTRELRDYRGRGVVNDVFVRLHGRHVWHRVRRIHDAMPGYLDRGRHLTFACFDATTEIAPDRRGRLLPQAIRTDQPPPGERCKSCRNADAQFGRDEVPARSPGSAR